MYPFLFFFPQKIRKKNQSSIMFMNCITVLCLVFCLAEPGGTTLIDPLANIWEITIGLIVLCTK
jgi:hypothetical protein